MFILLEFLLIVLLCAILFFVRREESAAKCRTMPRGMMERYWDGRERRRYVRFSTEMDVRYQIKKGAATKAGSSNDISESGARLLIDQKLERGAVLEMEILHKGASLPVCVEGVVVWCNEAKAEEKMSDKRLFHIGVRFLKVKGGSQRGFEKLMGFIEGRLRGDQAPDGVALAP